MATVPDPKTASFLSTFMCLEDANIGSVVCMLQFDTRNGDERSAIDLFENVFLSVRSHDSPKGDSSTK